MVKSRIFVLAAALIFISFPYQFLNAQSNFMEGFVINNENDTVVGKIDYRNWEKNPKSILFIPGGEQDVKSLSPLNIQRFGVADEIYVSAIVQANDNPYKSVELLYTPDIHFRTDTIFLQTVIEGKKSLYYYKDYKAREQMYIYNQSEYELLVFNKYVVHTKTTNNIKINYKYIGQLRSYLREYPEIEERSSSLNYNLKSIKKLFEEYYHYTNEPVLYSKPKEKTVIQFGGFAGGCMSTINIGSEEYTELDNTDFDASYTISAGIFMETILPRNRGKLRIRNELQYTTYKFEGEFSEYYSETHNSYALSKLGFSYLKLNTLFKYKISAKKNSLYFNTGLSFGIIADELNYQYMETINYGVQNIHEEKAINKIRNYEFGFIASLGGNIDHFFGEIRFEAGDGMSNSIILNVTTYRYYILFGYRFL
jgi:hypothetical protein